MMLKLPQKSVAWSQWTARLAVFAVGLVATALVLHRIYLLPTPAMLNLVKLAMLLAAVTVVTAIAAYVVIWRTGRPGAASATFGLLVALALFAWPAALLPTVTALPAINDVTTDTARPPEFRALAAQRPRYANPVAYPRATFAARQIRAYPDIAPLLFDFSSQDVFDVIANLLRRGRMKMEVVHAEPPQADGAQPGFVEAVDTTLILGFSDDVVVRVSGDQRRARVDVRSASRYGQHDLGQNAKRVRALLAEIRARVDAALLTPGGAQSVAAQRERNKGVKRPKGRGSDAESRRR